MTQHRLLIATDVPFWNRSTGAEQRIAALFQYLQKQQMTVRIFYILKLTQQDRDRIQSQGIDVHEATSDKPPSDRLKLIQWYAKATLHQLKSTFQGQSQKAKSDTLTLDDYCWPWAIEQFREQLDEFKPDSILIEYVKLAYLLDGMTEEKRRDTFCMLDTHDLLHRRNSQFRERGFVHWLDIDERQEASVVSKFDLVLAIQTEEATEFRKMAPNVKTIVVSHSLESSFPRLQVNERNNKIVIGYVGSKNFSNLSAISRFLKTAWSKNGLHQSPSIEMRIAGGICEWLKEDLAEFLEQQANIVLVGHVNDLSAFYSTVDIVVNPVEFGTGLKIKNCEALVHGCQLITTPMGSNGMPEGLVGLRVASTHDEMVEQLISLTSDFNGLSQMRHQVSQSAQKVFSDEFAYSELLQSMIGRRTAE